LELLRICETQKPERSQSLLTSAATRKGKAATIRTDADAIINTTEPGLVLGTPAYMSPEQEKMIGTSLIQYQIT